MFYLRWNAVHARERELNDCHVLISDDPGLGSTGPTFHRLHVLHEEVYFPSDVQSLW
jgi:hypothetical protein